MNNTKNDHYYALKMLGDIDAILNYAKRVDFSDPDLNRQSLDAINFRLIQIRESLGELTDDFIKNNPAINYEGLIGFRNLLTHDYGSVDFSVYKKVVYSDLVFLKKQLEDYLK
jgi:uncharacterized protein with HEPN domain